MKILKARYLLAVLLIVITAIVVHLLRYDSQYDNTAAIEAIHKIPLRIASWIGRDVHLDKRIYEILDTNAIIHRTYLSDNGDQVFLSIVHYADAKVDFHGPEGCLGGSGIEAEKRVETIVISTMAGKQDIDIAEIITDDNGSKTLVYYFFKVGDFTGQNYIQVRMNVAVNKLTKGDSSCSLIRISTPINFENSVDARATLLSFLSDLFPAIEQIL
ncbi:MAG: EpsI family protein [Desulfobacteraceae bacterium]|nr:EpsI family protein [Desulfobacteraceae bacterium]MBC2754817.1 EpsI family protein [Desulfobacteraceae bacterium]